MHVKGRARNQVHEISLQQKILYLLKKGTLASVFCLENELLLRSFVRESISKDLHFIQPYNLWLQFIASAS